MIRYCATGGNRIRKRRLVGGIPTGSTEYEKMPTAWATTICYALAVDQVVFCNQIFQQERKKR